MCLLVEPKTKWKFNIFPKTVYKFVRKINNTKCESIFYQEPYILNKIKKIPFKKIKSHKRIDSFLREEADRYSVGLYYYTTLDKAKVQLSYVDELNFNPIIVKCIIPPFSLRIENDIYEGITNKLKIVKYETV